MDKYSSIRDQSEGSGPPKDVGLPDSLRSATQRLRLPPSYVVVGVYRLLSDKALFFPVWQKCRSGFLKGIAVGSIWVRIHVSKLAVNRGLTVPNTHSHS